MKVLLTLAMNVVLWLLIIQLLKDLFNRYRKKKNDKFFEKYSIEEIKQNLEEIEEVRESIKKLKEKIAKQEEQKEPVNSLEKISNLEELIRLRQLEEDLVLKHGKTMVEIFNDKNL